VVQLILFLLLYADESYVFVHQNNRVAFHKSGEPQLILFDKGREPWSCGGSVFYWDDAGIFRGEVATGKSILWRGGNLRSPHCDGKRVIWGEMVGGRWSIMISPIAKADPKLLFQSKDSVYNPSFFDGGVVASDLYKLYFLSLEGKLLRTIELSEIGGGGSSSDRFLVRGSQILFSSSVDGLPSMDKQLHGEPSSALFLYDEKTHKKTRLTPADTFAIEPAWVGESIYFRGFRAGKRPLREGILRLRGETLERVQAGYEPGN
jgi:hypothetical protein